MTLFKNIKEAHQKFKFPGSHRIGTVINNNLAIRVYSNSISAPDYFNKNFNKFYYFIKNDKILNAFKNNKLSNKNIYLFVRDLEKGVVVYHGQFKVMGFRKKNKYVLLEKCN